MLQAGQMKTVGWLCIFYAIITPALVVFGAIVGATNDAELKLVAAIVSVPSSILGIYILVSFRRLLNEYFGYHDIDIHITIIVWSTVVSVVVSFVGVMVAEIGLANILPVLLMGVVAVAFGIKLLNLKEPFRGLLKPFCYTNIAAGICYASIILVFLGFVGSIVANVITAMIFFQMADRVQQSEFAPG